MINDSIGVLLAVHAAFIACEVECARIDLDTIFRGLDSGYTKYSGNDLELSS